MIPDTFPSSSLLSLCPLPKYTWELPDEKDAILVSVLSEVRIWGLLDTGCKPRFHLAGRCRVCLYVAGTWLLGTLLQVTDPSLEGPHY